MTGRQAAARPIRFEATLQTIARSTLLRVPEPASRKLPSRGQVAVRGSINGVGFDTVVEPDGSFGHWIRVDRDLQRRTRMRTGELATVEIEPSPEWPEPVLPDDFETALSRAPLEIRYLWHEITPMARWEWVRWINSTNNPETRRRRVEVSISKMKSGKRRPCCFNLAACTDPNLSRSGKLLEPVD